MVTPTPGGGRPFPAGRRGDRHNPLSFPIWQAELGRICEHLREADRAEAWDRLGRAPLDHELGRTPRQRRLDAMRLTAERSAAYNGDLGPSSFCLNMHGGTDLVAKILERIIEALEADSPDGDVLRHGHARRLFTPAQAQAIRAKFWRCAHPYGCDRTYPFLQSDHMTEHTRAAAPTPGSGPPERG